MLKYITRHASLQRIPIVMMSAQDDVTVVMKCLKLGAADYLVKPLRINELLNLWIHMWRRRRTLGLADKNIISRNLNHDLDMLVSDPSDSNTNSTNLFSDDTNDKKVRSHVGPETSTLATHPAGELQSNESPGLELSLKRSSESPELSSLAGKFASYPKKSELKFGRSSAFLTYVNASGQANKIPNLSSIGENKSYQQETAIPQKHHVMGPPSIASGSIGLSHSSEAVKSSNRTEIIPCEEHCRDGLEARSCNASVSPEIPVGQVAAAGEQFPMVWGGLANEGPSMNNHGISSLPTSHFLPGMMNHSLMSSSMQMCHGVPHDVGSRVTPGLMPFHAMQPCHGMPVNATMPYYPYGFLVAPAQLGPSHAWPGMPNLSVSEPKISQVERREAALNKFRKKRKDRCFDKKIRYVSRKRLAEQRPRVRGQFVRQANNMEAGANGIVYGVDFSEDEDDGYAHGSNELGLASSPESLGGDPENIIQYQR